MSISAYDREMQKQVGHVGSCPRPTLADVVVPLGFDVCQCDKNGCVNVICLGECGCSSCEGVKPSYKTIPADEWEVMVAKAMAERPPLGESEVVPAKDMMVINRLLSTRVWLQNERVWYANSEGDVAEYIVVDRYAGGELILNSYGHRFTVNPAEVFSTKKEAVDYKIDQLITQRDEYVQRVENTLLKLYRNNI